MNPKQLEEAMKNALTKLKIWTPLMDLKLQDVLDEVSTRLGRTSKQMMPIMSEFKAQYKRTMTAMLCPPCPTLKAPTEYLYRGKGVP